MNGAANWLFYGHANASQTGMDACWLTDIKAFRAGLIRQANGDRIRSGHKANPVGMWFKGIDSWSFPQEPRLAVEQG